MSDTMSDGVFVTPEDIQVANESSSFLLAVPPDASTKGNPANDGGRAAWKQACKIASVTYTEDAEIKDAETGVVYTGTVIEVDFQIPPDAERLLASGDVIKDPNAGRSMRQWYKLVDKAQGDKSHPKYKAFYFNLGRLKGLLVAAGFSLPDGGFGLKSYFSNEILMGASLTAIFQRSWWKGKPQDQIDSFLAPSIANA